MAIYIDASYWAWDRAFAKWKASQEGRELDVFANIDNLLKPTTFFAMDSAHSIRKDVLPWYKANRDNPPAASLQLEAIVHKILPELRRRYPDHILEEFGLEADDVIAMHAQAGDFVWANDKDYLQLPKEIMLTNFRTEFWGTERFKTEYKIKRGQASLAFQLLHGDAADNIPRRWYGDKATTQWIIESDNPLLEAIRVIPPQQVRTSLVALVLPCPLHNLKRDIIEEVLERWAA